MSFHIYKDKIINDINKIKKVTDSAKGSYRLTFLQSLSLDWIMAENQIFL